MSATEDYIDRIASGASRSRPTCGGCQPAERLGDALFTGLRLTDGVDLARFVTRYGVDVWERYRTDLEPFVEDGLLRADGARLRLTRRGNAPRSRGNDGFRLALSTLK